MLKTSQTVKALLVGIVSTIIVFMVLKSNLKVWASALIISMVIFLVTITIEHLTKKSKS